MSSEFDIVVFGGGLVGLWLVCELGQAEVKVTVLERRYISRRATRQS
ncbi:MAG TPA: hypothetical protein VHU44_06510 [Acidobacteriaceae bacterium]|nr:hypothetical protein [Acidobacteriaceae bacterium]